MAFFDFFCTVYTVHYFYESYKKDVDVNDYYIDPKKANKERILGLFFLHEALSKPQIAELTGFSLPTINGHMKDLENMGMIGPGELMDSSGGRPAISYRLLPRSKLALGAEIRKDFVKICLCDLKGEVVKLWNIGIEYKNEKAYSAKLNSLLKEAISTCGYPLDNILGIGVAIQGVVNKAGTEIIFSKILDTSELDLEIIKKDISIPVRLCHDVKTAALAELWHNRKISNGIYIAMSEHLGGSLIKSRCIEHGRSGYAGSWDHVTFSNKGKLCYCGKRGCIDTYCNFETLFEGESIPDFFFKLREEKSKEYKVRWSKYLSTIAFGLYQAWLILERRIILGGELAMWLNPEDVAFVESEIINRSTFTCRPGFVIKANVEHHACAIGAALPYLAEEIPEPVRPIEAWSTYCKPEITEY